MASKKYQPHHGLQRMDFIPKHQFIPRVVASRRQSADIVVLGSVPVDALRNLTSKHRTATPRPACGQ
jgi:hypothetical protein